MQVSKIQEVTSANLHHLRILRWTGEQKDRCQHILVSCFTCTNSPFHMTSFSIQSDLFQRSGVRLHFVCDIGFRATFLAETFYCPHWENVSDWPEQTLAKSLLGR